MKLVKFEDGTYGVRTFWLFGWYFKDLKHKYVWRRGEYWFRDCKGSKEQALKIMGWSKYTIVDVDKEVK